MQHISQTGLPPVTIRQSRGGRIGSPKLRQTLAQCEDFAGLEEDTNRYDLLLLVKRVGKSAGFTPRMMSLLDYYMSFTRDIDWEEGASPIVYQSLSRTALDLGVSERQIQKLEKALFEVGALTWNDSGNHRRYGQRDEETGMIVYAYGVDLTPLAYLKAALQDKLHEKKLYEQAWMEQKRQISWYRRQIKAGLCEIAALQEEEGIESAASLHEFEASYNAIAVQIRTHMDLPRLLELTAEHKSLYEHVLKTLETAQMDHDSTDNAPEITNKSSSTSEERFIHYKSTNKKQSNKLDTSSSSHISFQESSNENSEPQKVHTEDEDSPNSKEEENPILKTGLQHITLKQALNAASERFRNHMPLEPRPMEWGDFVEAAYKIKGDLFISQQSWANACMVLGRGGAAICVLLTDQAAQREENRVMKPAAYFNAMISRAKRGELKLHQSVFGILKRDNDNAPEGEGRDHA